MPRRFGARPHLTTARRDDERVRPLELFFDLVFVLAITQCTELMAHEPTWSGLARGLLTLGLLWWAWVGYAWLTSVVDPEEGAVRFVIFAAMAATLVVTICIPDAFHGTAVTFAIALSVLRVAHIALFVLGSRDDPGLRASVIGLAISTGLAVVLVTAGAFAHGTAQEVIWLVALVLDVGGPFLFGASGWRIVAEHFAERHGLILLIALGESIVAIGVGAGHGVDGGVVAGVVLAMAVVAGLWWSYFDLASITTTDSLVHAAPGKVQNEMARDGYSYAHFPMVAGIVLGAVGTKLTIGELSKVPSTVAGVALSGGAAVHHLGYVGFQRRVGGVLSRPRLALAAILGAWTLAAPHVPAVVTLSIIAAGVWTLVTYETLVSRERRAELRRAAHRHPEDHSAG